MAEPRWKTAAGARLVSVYGDCLRARDHLGAALRDLESEELLDTRDAAGRYVVLDSAATNVGQASSFLSAAMGDMEAAELIALRGCGPAPTDPVASVARVRDADHGVWLALRRLQDAREYARQALVMTEVAFGHMWAAQFIGARLPPAADPDAVMEDQVRAAMDQIRTVLD
ncbi:hypothetical protein ACQ4PT_008557 [Festuca glaucescens]